MPLLAALVLLCAIPSRALAWQVISSISYPSPGAPGGSQLMDLYLPDSGTPTAGYTIIIEHGGSYYAGDRNGTAWLCQMLADQGYAAITAEYTLVTDAMIAAGIGSFPQPVTDMLNVVHWVRTDGEALGLPNPVIFSGISAGATVALNAAYAEGNPTFHPLPAPAHRGYTIDGAIGVSGRYDLVWNVLQIGVLSSVAQYVGMWWWQPGWDVRYAQASATSYVNGCSAPAVLFHGSVDSLVPVGNSYRLAQALDLAGAPVQLHILIGYDHDVAVIGNTNQEQLTTYLNAIAWIHAHQQGACGREAPAVAPAPPGPIGTCCTSDARCFLVESTNCGALWGPATTCPTGPCPAGACCDSNNACSMVLQSACPSGWSGGGTSCTPSPCGPQPPGACCDASGSCASVAQSACASGWRGVGSSCTPNACPQPGVCCAPSGICLFVQQTACLSGFQQSSSCNPNPCSQPGACCAASGACSLVQQAACQTVFQAGLACATNPCQQPIGACCTPSGVCSYVPQLTCQGDFQLGVLCSPGLCPQQRGACCMGAVCKLRTADACSGPNTSFIGVGAACNLVADAAHPCCTADFDKNSIVTVTDIFRFLGDWFAGASDTQCSTSQGPTPVVADIFVFLSAWFRGC